MAASQSNENFGIIILGNSGVGKSFLANILLGKEKFIHNVQPEAVTTETTWADTQIGQQYYRIFNIPGLIEADQTRIEINKREIQKAFVERPVSIILYVFGQQNGRIRDEDVIALNALHAAYSLNANSLSIIVNGVSKNRSDTYEGQTMGVLKRTLKIGPFQSMVVLDHIDQNDENEKQKLQNKLINLVMMRTPRPHTKKQELELHNEQLAEEKRRVKALREDYERRETEFRADISRMQNQQNELVKKLDKTVRKLRRAESLNGREVLLVPSGTLPVSSPPLLVQVQQPVPTVVSPPTAPLLPGNLQCNKNFRNPNPY